jgi:hypothetical protein
MKFLSRYLRENGHKVHGEGYEWEPMIEEFGLKATGIQFKWKGKKGEDEGTFMKLFPDKVRKIDTEGWYLSKECNHALGLQYLPEKQSTLMPLLNDVNKVVLKHQKGTNAFGEQHLKFFSTIGIHVYEGKYHLLEHLHSKGHITYTFPVDKVLKEKKKRERAARKARDRAKKEKEQNAKEEEETKLKKAQEMAKKKEKKAQKKADKKAKKEKKNKKKRKKSEE